MAIICLEGPSAVGKTTTSRMISERCSAYVIPEIASLFGSSPDLKGWELSQWFMERQIERWKIAQQMSETYDLVVLDGDHFKLWYGWIYGIEPYLWEKEFEFYRQRLTEQTVGFPDGYFILTADEELLRQRKEGDPTRKRRNFEKHLKVIEPLNRFFEAVNEFIPGWVRFVPTGNLDKSVDAILDGVSYLPDIDPFFLSLLENMKTWMEKNDPNASV